MILTLDSGTTNTRAYIMQDGNVISSAFQAVGSRDTAITGTNRKLAAGVKAAIQEAMKKAGIDETNLEAIVASGMITSNMGLCEIPHVVAPAGKDDLAFAMQKRSIPAICDNPLFFIPGIKNTADKDEFDCAVFDMMRGEETETLGILSQLNCAEEAIVILPGSHTKLVRVGKNQQIAGCTTTIAGELAWAIAKSTIIADSLPKDMNIAVDSDITKKGAEFSRRFGLSRACFAVRTMHLFSKTEQAERLSFLLGAVLYEDIIALKEVDTLKGNLLIGGRRLFRDLFAILLQQYCSDVGIVCLSDEVVKNACPKGAWTIWNCK